MALLLQDVLSSSVFQRTRPELLSGADQLSRPIRWVHSTDVYEAAALLHGGELLLTTMLGLAGEPASRRRRYVRELDAIGLAALCLELGWTFDRVPDDMVDEARQVGLPLIALQHIVPFVEITEALNGAIVDASIVSLRFADRLSQLLSDALAHGAGLEQLVELLARELHTGAALIDSDGGAFAAYPAGVSAADMLAAGGHSGPVGVDGVPFASLVVGHAPGQPPDVVAAALERAGTAFALELLRHRYELATRVQATRQLFERMLAPTHAGRPLAPLAVAAGLPASGAVYVTAVADDAVPRSATALRDAVNQLSPQHAVTTIDGQALAVVALPAEPAAHTDAPDERLAVLLRRQLPATGRPRAAVGLVVGDLNAVAASLAQARAALEAGSMVAGTGAVAVAARLTAERLLLRLPPADLAELVAEQLGGLIRLPPPRREDLIATLEAYLANGRRKSETARQLQLQRQSLYQRLQRIRTLLGRDIDEPALAAGLTLAVRAWRIQQAAPLVTR
jgi:purine catabolism regulator